MCQPFGPRAVGQRELDGVVEDLVAGRAGVDRDVVDAALHLNLQMHVRVVVVAAVHLARRNDGNEVTVEASVHCGEAAPEVAGAGLTNGGPVVAGVAA